MMSIALYRLRFNVMSSIKINIECNIFIFENHCFVIKLDIISSLMSFVILKCLASDFRTQIEIMKIR